MPGLGSLGRPPLAPDGIVVTVGTASLPFVHVSPLSHPIAHSTAADERNPCDSRVAPAASRRTMRALAWLAVVVCARVHASPTQLVLQQPGASDPPSGPSRPLPRDVRLAA